MHGQQDVDSAAAIKFCYHQIFKSRQSYDLSLEILCGSLVLAEKKPVVGIDELLFLPSGELFVQQSQKYVCFHFSCFVFFLGCLFYIALVDEAKKFCIMILLRARMLTLENHHG
jgi:hypothetical protein